MLSFPVLGDLVPSKTYRNNVISQGIRLKPRLHQGNMLPGNMFPATKLLPVCCQSAAGYKRMHVAELQATCCR